jgi:MinD-like ATPase involved in chromosome partitioning or flagellar assembly
MSGGKALAFHSYKGGTGKTTVVTNLAAIYAAQGLRVCIIDLDLYAPGLTTYFRKKPKTYLNHVLHREEEIADALLDLTDEIGVSGKLYLLPSSPHSDDIHRIELQSSNWHTDKLDQLIAVKNTLYREYQIDYLLFDTSPGVKYWSINAIVLADILFLLMTINDTNIEGTKRMVTDIYDNLAQYNTHRFILANKIPSGMAPQPTSVSETDIQGWEKELTSAIKMTVVESIQCFCDIQFSRHEFLFAINQPDHPFSIKMHNIATAIHEAINQK